MKKHDHSFRRITALATAGVMCAALFAGCSKEAASGESPSSGGGYDVLNVGTMALTCGIPVLYAQEQGYFEEAGLNVNIEMFATGAPSTRRSPQMSLTLLFRALPRSTPWPTPTAPGWPT